MKNKRIIFKINTNFTFNVFENLKFSLLCVEKGLATETRWEYFWINQIEKEERSKKNINNFVNMSHNYIVTAQKPTAVNACATGNKISLKPREFTS